mgnify:CR=1 FL=1
MRPAAGAADGAGPGSEVTGGSTGLAADVAGAAAVAPVGAAGVADGFAGVAVVGFAEAAGAAADIVSEKGGVLTPTSASLFEKNLDQGILSDWPGRIKSLDRPLAALILATVVFFFNAMP